MHIPKVGHTGKLFWLGTIEDLPAGEDIYVMNECTNASAGRSI